MRRSRLGRTSWRRCPGPGSGYDRLQRGDRAEPGLVVEDVAVLYEEYKASGARIRRPPENYLWAYEMKVEDPDGHVLRFGSEPRGDMPFDDWSG